MFNAFGSFLQNISEGGRLEGIRAEQQASQYTACAGRQEHVIAVNPMALLAIWSLFQCEVDTSNWRCRAVRVNAFQIPILRFLIFTGEGELAAG